MYISDGQSLLLILALLYLSECAIWLRKHSVAFVYSRGRWRIATPKSWLGNAKGALLFLNPLSPGRLLVSHLLPLSISPSGVCAFNGQTLPLTERPLGQSGKFISFSEIVDSSTDGAYLLINDERFVKCATSKQAKSVSNLLKTTTTAAPAARESLVRSFCGKQFSVAEAAAIFKDADELIRPIRWVGSSLFLFLFVAAPVLVFAFGLERLLIPLAVVMLVLAIQISIMFFRAHKKLYPQESTERWESLVKMLLCPPVSIRAADLLTRNLLSDYSPMVLVDLLRVATGPQFMRAFILDLQHPLKHEVIEEGAAQTIAWAAGEQLRFSLQHIERSGDAKSEGVLDPVLQEGNSISYCPRCGCQFRTREGECADCPGIELVVFPEHAEVD